MKDNQEIAKDYTDWHVKTGGFARDKTLRDEFAGLAMQGIIYEGAESSVEVATWAYGMAEAMLKERAK
jgi:hypothetical protein